MILVSISISVSTLVPHNTSHFVTPLDIDIALLDTQSATTSHNLDLPISQPPTPLAPIPSPIIAMPLVEPISNTIVPSLHPLTTRS